MKSKQLAKGLGSIMDEGVAQFTALDMNGRKVVGTTALQMR
jgi:peptide subunit release factor RF-3